MIEPDRPHMPAHALCVLDNEGYRHTLGIYIEYLILFHYNSGYMNAPQYYVIHIGSHETHEYSWCKMQLLLMLELL
jgi:hypothetical protein